MTAELVPILLSSSSVALAVGAFLHGWNKHRRLGHKSQPLVPLWRKATAAGGIPTAITLIVCSFKPVWLSFVPGLNLPIALGGLSLLYVCLEALGAPDETGEKMNMR